jgi:hypothetical protein
MNPVVFSLSILTAITGGKIFVHFTNRAMSRMFPLQSRFPVPGRVPTLGFSFPKPFPHVKHGGLVRHSSVKRVLEPDNCL